MFNRINRKIIHVILIIVVIFVILFVSGIFILRYQVEGESNMPFTITKISIIQTVEGIENNDTENKWNFNVNENNDIYIYLEKNSNYNKTEIIESVTINNISIKKENEIGTSKIYKPVTDEKRMFINTTENETTEITYTGALESNIKQQEISNQGGKIAFRYAIDNISQYISQNAEEINHSQLLKLTNVQKEDIQSEISFELTIKLKSGKVYKTDISVEIPGEDVIEEGTKGIEITDLQNIIFKRLEN